ncbi:MAG: cupin domain-containing protein [Pseudomonadota bacterium]
MEADVRRATDVLEYDTEERCAIQEVSNDLADPEVSIARARVLPGVTTAWHELTGTNERYLIIAGEGRVEVGETIDEMVGVGDVIWIPAGAKQRITNTGDSDLIFYAICTPRFKHTNYVTLE